MNKLLDGNLYDIEKINKQMLNHDTINLLHKLQHGF